MSSDYTFHQFGDDAVLMKFHSSDSKILAFCRFLRTEIKENPVLLDFVQAFQEVAVYYGPNIERKDVEASLTESYSNLAKSEAELESTLHEIPICYEEGLDLKALSKQSGKSEEALIELHLNDTYEVELLGFMPGFVYAGPVHKYLKFSRLDTPRLSVEAGSVGLARGYTGIYGMSSPGGWNIIGRTPSTTFDCEAGINAILAGDRLKFNRISSSEFVSLNQHREIENEAKNGDAVFELMGHPTFMTIQSLQVRTKGHEVIPKGGVLSSCAAVEANGLVQNDPDATVLEFGLSGTILKCLKSVVCSLSGALCDVRIDGQIVDTSSCFQVQEGQLLELGKLKNGNWAYLAIENGFAQDAWCGAKGTLVGIHGAVKQKGHILYQAPPSAGTTVLTVKRETSKEIVEMYPGPDLEMLPDEVVKAIWSSQFKCKGQMSRIGYQLEASKSLKHDIKNMRPVVTGPGIIQLPPSGDPIVLMVDAPRTGGYPRIGILDKVSLEIIVQNELGQGFDFVLKR